MTRSRLVALLAAPLLVLSACGSPADPAPAPVPAVQDAPLPTCAPQTASDTPPEPVIDGSYDPAAHDC
ncbi:hypothetical protein [Planomonospora parontospora]|uniref:hypothetical protein n=1 Tax=Planomonospora parontospora TaxID=58119 RepID=UPI001670A8EE|nr:hypothetical protein [Planomonospora parontospora]GGL56560.1 hypothetical protein GCM10014719_67490 [Planomonospora parontospora subsp. antibiotica]GII19939.1 hypothetical protein Ppa05_66650 [Planomonospora parontospora subsp. antibiotica]